MPHDDRVQLIPRDQPIPHGRELVFEFKVAFRVMVDEDLTGDDTALTLDQIEAMSGSVASPDAVWRMVANMNVDRDVLDHVVRLADVARDEGRDERPRFELEWERQERERGTTDGWKRSRVWLDAIPAPTVGASA